MQFLPISPFICNVKSQKNGNFKFLFYIPVIQQKVLKNKKLLHMVAENTVKNTGRKQYASMSHIKLSII
jgi:hypothetical protein